MENSEVKTPVSQTVQYVVGTNGEPTAVLVDIQTWNRILEIVKDTEDVVKENAPVINNVDIDRWDLEKAGYRSWASIREEMADQILKQEAAKGEKVYDEDRHGRMGRQC